MGKPTVSDNKTSCCKVKSCKGDSGSPKEPLASNSKYAPFVKSESPTKHRITLHVSGIHCARCIWAIESNLQKEQHISIARVNMSTNRLTIEWEGELEQIDSFADIVKKLGYDITPISEEKKEHKEESFLLRCMAISGFAIGNIMLISVVLWSSNLEIMGLATRELLHWISALIALPTIIYAGRPFFSSAWAVLKNGHTNMDVPISLALLLASGMSLFETLRGGEHTYFDSAVMLLFFLLIGRWLDAKARGKARQGASELLELTKGTATILEDGKSRNVTIAELKEGDIVLVAAGEKIPTDVVVIEGKSEIDTSLVTGESVPRVASENDKLYGGTINLTSSLTCRVLQASEDSLLADIIRLMEQAEQGRAYYVRLADKAAQLYTPVVHTLAAAAFIGWFAFGHLPWQDALLIAITTLIITCPCALGLAVPVVQVLAIEWLMKRGILVKSGDALERLTNIDTIAFDKTGTITIGNPVLKEEDFSEQHLQLAASLADHSRHPLSRAISRYYQGKRVPIKDIKEIPGTGIEGTYKKQRVFLGKTDKESQTTTVTLELDGNHQKDFHFTDEIREEAEKTITAFKQHHITPYLLSGDRKEIVANMANSLSIENFNGELLPQQKLETLKEQQEQGHRIFMVGDGLNDAPSLAQANVSMSPASGMDITQNTADMVFQGKSLYATFQSWKMANFSTKLVKQNFALAVLYNACAIPLALAGMVTPLIAAIAMSASSLIVIGNSFRIRFVSER